MSNPSPARKRLFSDYPSGSPIYTWVNSDTGQNINIDAAALRLHCLGLDTGPVLVRRFRYDVHYIPTDGAMARTFILENVVSMSRVEELRKAEIDRKTDLDPVIFCLRGTFDEYGRPDVFLVDGHHRYVVRTLQGRYVEAFMLRVPQWEPFIIHGVPRISREALLSSTSPKRNYL